MIQVEVEIIFKFFNELSMNDKKVEVSKKINFMLILCV